MASSKPGNTISEAFISRDSPPKNGVILSVSFGMCSPILASGSNSIPHRPGTPSTSIGVEDN